MAVRFILILFLLGPMIEVHGQEGYSFTAYGGWLHNIAKRGPEQPVSVTHVKFVRPVTKTIGFAAGTYRLNSFNYGLEFFYDEFDYGYHAAPHVQHMGLGITSGLMAASDRIGVWKAGVRVGYLRSLNKRLTAAVNFIPSLGLFPHSWRIEDTTDVNDFWRKPKPHSIQYVQYPAYQNNSLKFFQKVSAEIAYNFSRHLAGSVTLSYQQGFSKFVSDTVKIIRVYEPNGFTQEEEYWTTVNGTSVQIHFGLSYRF